MHERRVGVQKTSAAEVGVSKERKVRVMPWAIISFSGSGMARRLGDTCGRRHKALVNPCSANQRNAGSDKSSVAVRDEVVRLHESPIILYGMLRVKFVGLGHVGP
ncbi:hypothetical protein RRG08_023791 [Elysia crispata]|uniref:Uncharacterized protein n=1 Tax=Elysia crispata TaxID=231223 RepID=A0AAE0ZVJ9_9GAST|nr:hypothetical protein RRG08_023791 [Elysia crispata]